jgi:RHS repeat-associated protein
MEMDDEVKGNTGTSYDFGARIYDPRVGRFLSTDAMFKVYPALTPYSFVDNSPIVFIDKGGNFKVSITQEAKEKYGITEQQLTNFQHVVNNMQTYLKDNPKVAQAIAKQTGYSVSEVLAAAEPGEGPTIVLAFDAQSQFFGANVNATDAANNEIHLDASIVVNFESMSFESEEDRAAFDVVVAGLILHEFTHLGDRQNNDGNVTGQGTQNSSGDPNDNGVQNRRSAFDHRGSDTEFRMYGVNGVGVEQSTDQSGDNNFKISPSRSEKAVNNQKNNSNFQGSSNAFRKDEK